MVELHRHLESDDTPVEMQMSVEFSELFLLQYTSIIQCFMMRNYTIGDFVKNQLLMKPNSMDRPRRQTESFGLPSVAIHISVTQKYFLALMNFYVSADDRRLLRCGSTTV